MTSETTKIANAFREAGHDVSDKDCEEVYRLCEMKMQLCKVHDREAYMTLLFADELKNLLISRFINAVTIEYLQTALSKGV